MATLANIQKKIARLEKQAEAIRKTEAAAAAATARDLIARHHLSAADVGLAAKPGKATKETSVAPTALRRKVAVAKPAGVPKYRDPKSGKTWTGTGKPPGWIAGAKNRDKFLINVAPPAADIASATGQASPKTVPTPAPSAAKPVARPVVKPAVKPAAKPDAEVATAAAPVKQAVFGKAAAKKRIKPTEPPAPAPAEVVAPTEAAGN